MDCGVDSPNLHQGIDYGLSTSGDGEAIAAAAGGTAKSCNDHPDFGNFVLIDHGTNNRTLYGHMKYPGGLPSGAGQSVARGEVIGFEGTTGFSTGNHLHFQTLQGSLSFACSQPTAGTTVDPNGLWQDNPPNHADYTPAISAYSSYQEYVRRGNNMLYQRQNGGGWNVIPTATCVRSGPGAAGWSSGRIVLARGCDNYMYKTIWNGSSWSAWTKTHTAFTCLWGAPTIANPIGDDLYVYYRGCNDVVYETVSLNGGSTWSPSAATPLCARSAPGATANGTSRIDILYRSCSGDAIGHAYKTSLNGGWSVFILNGTCTMVAPGIASWNPGTVDGFHRGYGAAAGGGEGIYRATYTGGSWSWSLMPQTCTASGIGADTWAPDRLDAAYRSCTLAAPGGDPFVVKAYRTGVNPGDPWTHISIGSWP